MGAALAVEGVVTDPAFVVEVVNGEEVEGGTVDLGVVVETVDITVVVAFPYRLQRKHRPEVPLSVGVQVHLGEKFTVACKK